MSQSPSSHPPFASAHSVNPEAGDHPISADPVEQAAAAAAVRRSWKDFPYYPRRYGERGWRFSLSDTGWIETLCSLSAREAESQVFWLGGLLAARGMPTYLLERHIEFLHDELVRPAHARNARYDVLKAAATALGERRRAQMSDTVFEALSAAFEHRVATYPEAVPNMGRVIVSAVADERAGIAGVAQSVADWACDPTRFAAVWIDSVKQTLVAARGAGRAT